MIPFRLQRFVDKISKRFIREAPELMREEFEREGVKLHATLMNSKFLEERGELELHRGKRRFKQSKTINAAGVFKVGVYSPVYTGPLF